jgi:hypothetical protein
MNLHPMLRAALLGAALGAPACEPGVWGPREGVQPETPTVHVPAPEPAPLPPLTTAPPVVVAPPSLDPSVVAPQQPVAPQAVAPQAVAPSAPTAPQPAAPRLLANDFPDVLSDVFSADRTVGDASVIVSASDVGVGSVAAQPQPSVVMMPVPILVGVPGAAPTPSPVMGAPAQGTVGAPNTAGTNVPVSGTNVPVSGTNVPTSGSPIPFSPTGPTAGDPGVLRGTRL